MRLRSLFTHIDACRAEKNSMIVLFQETMKLPAGEVLVILQEPGHFVSTCARVSAFCEHPVFQGEVFDLEELQSYWQTHLLSPYERNIRGCNFSSKDVIRFQDVYADAPLSAGESALVEAARGREFLYFAVLNSLLPANPTDFFFSLGLTLKHELSHALFYLDGSYRAMIHELWASLSMDRREEIYQLYAIYYASHRVLDEWAAHIVSSLELSQILDLSDEQYIQLKRTYWQLVDGDRFAALLARLIEQASDYLRAS